MGNTNDSNGCRACIRVQCGCCAARSAPDVHSADVRSGHMNNAVAADIHTALVTASTPLDLASIVAGIAAADSVSTSTVDFANHAVADCQMLSNSA